LWFIGVVAELSRRWVARVALRGAGEGAAAWLKVLNGQMGFVGQWLGQNRP
jgi:hypothetical protein